MDLSGIPILGACVANLGECGNAFAIGLFNGLIIALIAIGYTLVYGILQLINFANGDIFMLGTVMTYFGVQILGLHEGSPALTVVLGLAAILIIMTITATINASIERLAYRPLRNAPSLATLISAIGMSFVLQNVGQAVLGPSPKSLPQLLNDQQALFMIGSVKISLAQAFVAAVTIPLLAGLVWFVRSTKQGKAMRATAQDRSAAGLMGIDVNRTISTTFLLAGALAGGAGLVVALYLGNAWWFFGFPFGLLAFTAAVLGGIGNLTGAAVGGIFLGLVKAMMDRYVDARWTDVVVFSILVLVLVFRPTGLLGEKQAEGA